MYVSIEKVVKRKKNHTLFLKLNLEFEILEVFKGRRYKVKILARRAITPPNLLGILRRIA
jgi:hypothetical protein